MDPVTGAVVAGVLFAASIPASWFLPWLVSATWVVASPKRSQADYSNFIAVSLLASFMIAGAWSVYALIQVVLQVIHLVQLLS